jgi:hypothetical protein
MFRGQTVTEIQDTQIDVTGGSGSSAYGIYALGGDWTGSEKLTLRNVVINSSANSQSAGISLESGTSIWLNIFNSTIEALIGSTTKGIFQGGAPPVYVQHSIVSGFTKTVEETLGSFSIQGTGLFGGPATAALFQGCMGVWDENAQFYPNGCPQ